MQLWQMLGRKVFNLGRVIDGERNASLGAQKAPQNSSGTGLSVQDELQSFFAETQNRDDKNPKVPVKGTIMSFFAKQKEKTSQTSSKAPTTTEEEGTAKIFKLKKPGMHDLKSSKVIVEMIEWDCKACTFHNRQPRQSSGFLVCEMCGTQDDKVIIIDDQDIPFRKVTPASARKGQLETISLSKPEIVTIDEIETKSIDVVPRNLDSSLENAIVLCDVSKEPRSLVTRSLSRTL